MSDDSTTTDGGGDVSNGSTDTLADFVTSRPDELDPDDVTDRVDVDEEIRKQARYEALHSARGNAAESLEKATLRVNELASSRGTDKAEARNVVAAAVRDRVRRYALELEPYLTTTRVGRHYWTGVPLGTVEFDPLRASVGAAGLGRGGAVVEERTPDPVQIVGLAEFVEAPDRFVREVEADDGTATATDRQVQVMPREVSRRAFRVANQFARDVGLDIDPEDETADAAFTTDDL